MDRSAVLMDRSAVARAATLATAGMVAGEVTGVQVEASVEAPVGALVVCSRDGVAIHELIIITAEFTCITRVAALTAAMVRAAGRTVRAAVA